MIRLERDGQLVEAPEGVDIPLTFAGKDPSREGAKLVTLPYMLEIPEGYEVELTGVGWRSEWGGVEHSLEVFDSAKRLKAGTYDRIKVRMYSLGPSKGGFRLRDGELVAYLRATKVAAVAVNKGFPGRKPKAKPSEAA